MPEGLRNTGIVLLLSLLVFAIFKITTEAKKLGVDDHVDRIGQKLLALVPAGESRAVMDDYYADLSERIRNDEVDPEEVERVIASFLNARGESRELTSAETQAILGLATLGQRESPTLKKFPQALKPAKPATPKDWVALEKRIDNALAFSDLMEEKRDALAPRYESVKPKRLFRVEDRLHIVVDDTLKEQLKQLEFKELAAEVKRLGNNNIIRWQSNIERDSEEKKRRFQIEIEHLEKEMENGAHLSEVERETRRNVLEALKTAEAFNIVVPVPFDSMFKDIEIHVHDNMITAPPALPTPHVSPAHPHKVEAKAKAKAKAKNKGKND